jgi:hypothetical protein
MYGTLAAAYFIYLVKQHHKEKQGQQQQQQSFPTDIRVCTAAVIHKFPSIKVESAAYLTFFFYRDTHISTGYIT